MYDYEVAKVIADGRRKAYEREAEIHRWLREATAVSRRKKRAALSSRVLFGVGRLLVRAGMRMQKPYDDRVWIAVSGRRSSS